MNLNRKNIIAMLAVGGSLAFGPALLAQDATNTASTNTPPASAQGGQARGQNVDRMMQRLTAQLNLTDDQQTKVKAVLQNQMSQMGDIRQDTTLSPDDRRTKMMAVRQDTMTQMQGILTPDQYTQYQQMMQRMRRPGMGSGGTNAPAAGAPPATPPPPQQ